MQHSTSIVDSSKNQTFYLFRKNGKSYLASDNTELLRDCFCSNPQTLSGSEVLLLYGSDLLEESIEKMYVNVKSSDGELTLHMPCIKEGYGIKKAMEAIGFSFITIFKEADSTPRLFTENGTWQGKRNIDAYLNQFS
ncbi:MAG: hypothetical protein KBB54_04000 [Candidatus Pacebacteria bacterium]|nr:hypothetical protein [Candidatus Paceibacterota bacterium]MBP9700900.1 hypothetical protein [Candidatus Paceibacterota bacterium]